MRAKLSLMCNVRSRTSWIVISPIASTELKVRANDDVRSENTLGARMQHKIIVGMIGCVSGRPMTA